MPTLQESANAIGEALRDLEAEIEDAGDPALIEKAQTLHGLLAQGAVDHLVPLGLDWDEAAGNTAARGGGTDKTPPLPSE